MKLCVMAFPMLFYKCYITSKSMELEPFFHTFPPILGYLLIYTESRIMYKVSYTVKTTKRNNLGIVEYERGITQD